MANQYSSDVEKEKFVHDYLVDTITYHVNAPMNQSAYSAIMIGRSVCAGYAIKVQKCLMKILLIAIYMEIS